MRKLSWIIFLIIVIPALAFAKEKVVKLKEITVTAPKKK